MSNISQVKKESNWGDASTTINSNFQNLNTDLEKVKSSTTKFKGYFTSESSLKDKYPSPQSGDTAWVGEPYPGKVYDVQSGQWHNTNTAPDTGSIELNDYVNKTEFEENKQQQDEKFTELNQKFNELNISNLYKTQGIDGTNRYTLESAIAQVPSEYRTIVGLKITFINNITSKTETWKYDGGTFTSTDSWKQGDGSGGNLILEWNTDVATTRKQVLQQDRKSLLQISYKNKSGDVINEQYIGTTFDDAAWSNNSNWEPIATDVEVDKSLNEESEKPIANAPVAKGINEVKQQLSTQLPAIEEAKEKAISEIGNKESEAVQNFSDQRVTPPMLSPETMQLINASGGGSITNLPDGETLAEIEIAEGTKAIGIPNREADVSNLGYVILKKNKSLIEQITEANTIYEIRYSYDLGGQTLTMPENCVLKFEGGLITNGKVFGVNTKICAGICRIFGESLITEGSFINTVAYVEWYGAKSTSDVGSYVGGDTMSIAESVNLLSDVSLYINKAFTVFGEVALVDGVYYKAETTINIGGGKILIIPPSTTVVAYMNGNGLTVKNINKEDSTYDSDTVNDVPIEVIAENQFVATSSMATLITMSARATLKGGGTLFLGKSTFTIGILLKGWGYSYLDMTFSPHIHIRTIGGQKYSCYAPDVRDIIGSVVPDESTGTDGQYYYNRETRMYYHKENGKWIQKSPAYNVGNQFNTSLRIEASQGQRVINPYIELWDMCGSRGIEIVTQGDGWFNESTIKGTISNKHGSFFSIFAGGGGVSIHNWRDITQQCATDMQHDCRIFFASKCNVITTGNTWDLAWFNPPRVQTAFELCNKASNITLNGTDGTKYVLDNGEKNKYEDIPYFSPTTIIGKTYENVVKYRTPYNAKGFYSDKQRTYDTIKTLEELMTESSSPYNGMVSKYMFDNEPQTYERVIDIANNKFAYVFNLNASNGGALEMLNKVNVIYIEIDYFPTQIKDDNKCYVALSRGGNLVQKQSLRSDCYTSSAGGHLYVQKLFLLFEHIGRLDDLRLIFYAEEAIENTTIDIYAIKIWKDTSSTEILAGRPRFGGESKYIPDAMPCGFIWYDKTNDNVIINKGDSNNPDLSSLNKTSIVKQNETDVEIVSGVLNQWTGITTLNITLKASSSENYAEEFMIEFTTASSGEINVNITGVTWSGGLPEFKNSKTYQISIVNKLAVIAEF